MKNEKRSALRARGWLICLALVCLAGFGSSIRLVSARQEIPATAEPTTEETETPSPETQFSAAAETPSELSSNTEPPTASATAAAVLRAAPLPGKYAPDEILVRFRKSASAEAASQCLFLAQAEALYSIEGLDVWVAQVPNGAVAEALAMVSSCPQTLYAEPNYVVFAADTFPSDPSFGMQYGLTKIRAPQGWDYSTGSASVTIAIVDSGVDLTHPDLAAKIVSGYDFVNDDSIPQDDHFQSHGTHVAGIAAALSNNGIGVAGVSWGARIMPVKALDPIGFGFLSDVADGIVWAANHGAQIINLSLGGVSDSLALQDAVNYASSRGILLVAAAGNSGASPPLYPARYAKVIAVGAVDNLNNRLATSNFGTELDLVAPGWMIYSTFRSGGYGYNSGTSMAAPFVSGLAAVLYGIPGNGFAALARSQMESSALDLGTPGFDAYHGFGLIQMDSALRLALPSAPRPGGGFTIPLPRAPTLNLKFTAASTPTTTPTGTGTFTPSSVPPASNVPDFTATPSPAAPKTEARAQSPSWQLPCAGSAFLLAGLLLLWAAQRKKREG